MKPFMFWVQTVLPLVYDDSLSYYETLSKIVDYVNNMATITNNNSEAITQLNKLLEEMGDTVSEQIESVLDTMAETGELNDIIERALISYPINGKLDKRNNDERKHEVLRCALSYIYASVDSDCVERNTPLTPETGFKPVYDTHGNSWQSLLERDGIYTNDPVFSDKTGDYFTLYLNCTGFVSLCTMGRDYENSVYKLMFDANDQSSITEQQKLDKCTEVGSVYEKPWTIDFRRKFHSWEVVTSMERAGCWPIEIYNNTDGYNESNFELLETGDILSHARSGNNYPGGYSHCMLYVKSIEDIEAFNNEFNCVFKPMSYNTVRPGNRGYVIHCSYGINSAESQSQSGRNVIRIDRIEDVIGRSDNDWDIFVGMKGYSSPANSSKAMSLAYGIGTRLNQLFPTNRVNTIPVTNTIKNDEKIFDFPEYIFNTLVVGEMGQRITTYYKDLPVPVDLNDDENRSIVLGNNSGANIDNGPSCYNIALTGNFATGDSITIADVTITFSATTTPANAVPLIIAAINQQSANYFAVEAKTSSTASATRIWLVKKNGMNSELPTISVNSSGGSATIEKQYPSSLIFSKSFNRMQLEVMFMSRVGIMWRMKAFSYGWTSYYSTPWNLLSMYNS